MKRPTRELWERQGRLARYRAEERQRKPRRHRGPRKTNFVTPREVLTAPQRFDITRGSGPEVVKFLRALAARVLDQGKPVKLDFRFTESFYPAATILL